MGERENCRMTWNHRLIKAKERCLVHTLLEQPHLKWQARQCSPFRWRLFSQEEKDVFVQL